MNATSNQSTNESDPWVESGAMVYVAITVATCSAVIMCCTWFITHNKAVKRWLRGQSVYNTVADSDDEVEIQLTSAKEEEEGDFPNDNSSSFTLEDNEDSESEAESNTSDANDSDEGRLPAAAAAEAV